MKDKITELEKFIFEQFKFHDEFTESSPVKLTEGIMRELVPTMIDECLKYFVEDGNPEVWRDKLLDLKKDMLSHYA